MTKILAAALFVMLAGAVAVLAVPPTLAASAAPIQMPVPASFDTAMPAPQAPFDTTPITPFETVGASSSD